MSTDQAEEDKVMDFETDIDSWVIDKEESNGLPITFDKSQKEHRLQSLELKTMDKENIKQFSCSTERKSLRCFRISKRTSCQGPPSDSDGDKRTLYHDNEDSTNWNKKQIFEFPHSSLSDKGLPICKQPNSSSTSSLSSLGDLKKDKESLSSEEISAMLSEVEESSDNIQEKNRERLLSIENVSTLVDSKDKGSDSVPAPLKLHFNCPTCNCEYQSLDDLKCHEVVHRKSNFQLKSQQHAEQPTNQGQKKSSLVIPGSNYNPAVFLDTFKTHLIKQGAVPANVTDRKLNASKDSEVEDRASRNPCTTVQKLFKCSVCPYSCSELLIFKTHQILFHNVSQVLVCEYCNFETNLSADLATHIRVHFRLDCPHCDYQCTLKTSLDAHLMSTHADIKCYKCKKCEYSCKSESKFKKHLQLHKITSRYQCDDCNLIFVSKQVLKLHIKTHALEKKSFVCEKCKSCFSQKRQLKLHMRSHEQLYICAMCDSKFTQKYFLEVHMKIHSKALLKCEKCNSTFTKKNYLTLHMRIHVSESFKCKHCHFKGSNSSDLEKHICINKLYKVQRRSLVFPKTDTGSISGVKKTQDESEKKEKGNLRSCMLNENTKNGVEQTDNGTVFVEISTNGRKEKLTSRCKLITLRQNLPSRKKKVLGVESAKTSREIPKSLKKPASKEQNKSLNKFVCKFDPAARKNGSCKTNSKQNNWMISNKNHTLPRDQRRYSGRIRKEHLECSLNSVQILLTKKSTSKELFLDARRFINERFVHCYYQNQQGSSTTHQEHVERHLRQRNILSCRFCSYKTNSDRLLQQHTVKNHSWDPAFISWLFR